MTPAEMRAALVVEADRTKVRLDKLERYLAGDQDAWLEITVRLPETVAEVTVDKAIGEARQLALALATITKTLASLGEAEDVKPASEEDQLAAARKERERKRRAG